ncbi:LysR family transcriptional regulator [uncultured Hyphomonas sp.]|uniref:LysR family transcriptional regulator n=1 Tax=uncultured Hyphomonas sp. TaxID=225298 RepID=UPI0030D9D933|tara:strand:+ start:10210 stop:11118 length:909 start_codon:yes stop_codon:yes gene_type:complete
MQTDWDGIEEFVAVATCMGFKPAAEMLNVSTSHVSRAVTRLENAIGAPLFYRTTRKVSLTDTGRTVLSHCQQLIESRDELYAVVGGTNEPQGEIKITCPTSLGERYISPIVREFSQDYPKVEITLDLSNRLVDLIAEGIDLAIRTGMLEDSRLISSRVASRQFLVCASPAYLDAHGTPERLDDLKTHNCLTGSSSTWRFRQGGQHETLRPRGNWRSNSGASVLDGLLAGKGIGQLPLFYVAPYLENGRLIELFRELRPEPEPIWAVYPQARHLQPKVHLLVDRIRAQLQPAFEVRIQHHLRG